MSVSGYDGVCPYCKKWFMSCVLDAGQDATMKPKRGRPPTERGAYNALPGRKFGRVSDADWKEIRDAVDASGLSLVQWALPMMLKKARRELKK
jgi:hypothetical protein